MRSLTLLLAALGSILFPTSALAWGKTGHRVIAAIADKQLSGLARAHIKQLLGVESLEEASTWPDEMRADQTQFWQKTATPWHYVTLNGVVYDHVPPEGDALQALIKFRDELRDPATSIAEKQLALRFIVHLVGDLHQPFHAGKCCDRGGNDVKVTWFGKPTNLHAVWDSELPDEEQLSFTELAAKLERHTSPADVIGWWDVNPLNWARESGRIREELYPMAPAVRAGPAALSYAYVYRFTPVMELRLKQAGIRLAAFLNNLFAELPPTPAADNQR